MAARRIWSINSSGAGAGFWRKVSSTRGTLTTASRQTELTTVTANRRCECLTRNHVANANARTAAGKLNHNSPLMPKDKRKAMQAQTVEGANANASLMPSDTELL